MRNQLTPYNKTKSPKEFPLLLWPILKFLFVLVFEYYDLDILKYSPSWYFFYSVYIKLLDIQFFLFYPEGWEISLKTLLPVCWNHFVILHVPEALHHFAH